MSTSESTGLYTSMLDGAEHQVLPTEPARVPHANWKWFWLGLILAAAPLLIPYFAGLWSNPTYRYFPFAILAVAWLTYLRSDGYLYAPRGWFSWISIGFGILLVIFSMVIQFPWFSAVAFVIFCTAMLYAMRGEEDASLLVVALPLFTTIQLVRGDTLLVLKLQEITTWMSSVLLDFIAIPHAVRNNVIQLADRELFVAEACSGIQSVFTLGFLSLLIVAWKRRRFWMAPIYLGIACLLAIFANVIRVTVVATTANSFEFDLAEGWPHELLGYVALAIAFAFLLSFDFLIATILHRVPEESEFNPFVIGWNFISMRSEDEQEVRGTQRDAAELMARDQNNKAFRWAHQLIDSRPAQIGFMCLIGIVAIASAVTVLRSRRPADLVHSDAALVFDPSKDEIVGSLASFKLVDHYSNRGYADPRLGANSDIWECEWNGITAQFVLSQPHKGWHELCNCYERLDWSLLDRDIRSPDDFESFQTIAQHPDALASTYVLARFKQGPAQNGYLMFAGIGSDGTLVDAPDSLSAFTHRVWNRIDNTGVWEQNEVLMLQMWITTTRKLKPTELKTLQQEFVSVRASLADAILENSGRSRPAAQSQASRGLLDPKINRLARSAATSPADEICFQEVL